MRHGQPVEGEVEVDVAVELLLSAEVPRGGRGDGQQVVQLKGRPAEDEGGHDDHQNLDHLAALLAEHHRGAGAGHVAAEHHQGHAWIDVGEDHNWNEVDGGRIAQGEGQLGAQVGQGVLADEEPPPADVHLDRLENLVDGGGEGQAEQPDAAEDEVGQIDQAGLRADGRLDGDVAVDADGDQLPRMMHQQRIQYVTTG